VRRSSALTPRSISRALSTSAFGSVSSVTFRKSKLPRKATRFETVVSLNLVAFLGSFDFRNVTDDTELKALVDKAREMLVGVSADDLRTTAGVRAKVQQGMADLAAELDTMIVKTPVRKFRFNEE